MYVAQCVDAWLKVNASCPTCRQSILPEPDGSVGGGQYGTNQTTSGVGVEAGENIV